MAYEDNGQRLVGRVKLVASSDRIAYLELPNGYIIPHHFDDEDYHENEVVLIGPLVNDVERAPSALWPEVPWVGTVRILLDEEAVIDISGRLRTVPRNQHISLSVGNMIEGSDTKGILRVLAEKPIPQLEISLGEPFDVSRLQEQPSGRLTYDDFGGYLEIKARTKELIELPLQHREALLKIRARAIKGVLFTGSSGTGKTLLGRIIAHQAKAQFYKISGPEIISKYVGQSEEVIRAIFDDAKQQDRAIIFFDEIDSVAPQRSDESRRIQVIKPIWHSPSAR
jgi:transitional endoplasmic reticulum ATPase